MAMHLTQARAGEDGERDHGEAMREMFGPGHVDQAVRSAIQACWMALPKERRSAEEVEKQVRRVVDRALSNLHEDVKAFGLPTKA